MINYNTIPEPTNTDLNNRPYLMQSSNRPSITNQLMGYLSTGNSYEAEPVQQTQSDIPQTYQAQNEDTGSFLDGLLVSMKGRQRTIPSVNLNNIDYVQNNSKPIAASNSNQNIQNMIINSARQYGIDPTIALAMGQIESNFNPKAKASGSSAKGVYQFIDSTAKQYGIYGRQYDAAANIDAGMRLFKDNANSFIKTFGRQPTAGEIYLYHQQGSRGASKLLKNPDKLAIDVIGRERVLKNGGTVNMTAKQFADKWINKGNNLQAEFKKRMG